VDELHLAPLHRLLAGHAASLAQASAVHLALLHNLLTPQVLSPVQAAVAHFAPLHSLLTEQAVSPAHVATVHVALLHSLLTPQLKSSPQDLALHFTLLHTALGDVQSVSTEQRVAELQVTPAPQSLFAAHVMPFFVPDAQVRVHVPLVAPQMPLSQSAALWQTVLVPVEHVPPVHEPLSQAALLWQAAAFVEQVPVAEPVPEPQLAPPSQSALTWQAAPLVPHVPPVQEPLSQAAPL